ncbi:hypothetical protein ACFQZO_28100 [Bradyrhizobium sp. GCM10027634]|uniref:hypothetical protein n=1 Tax=unclassified Bradyrhizobium TaxID=2631580 RepID=UPI00188CC593|nr:MULTISPECIES: hypothetical protein [unclassified Bradyrhizobium]MDN5004719.1 hypothetical protein [Bradyrhizobium sp. WYCCWR 12677]
MRVSANWHRKMAMAAPPLQADLWSNAKHEGYHGFLNRNKILALSIGAKTTDPDPHETA